MIPASETLLADLAARGVSLFLADGQLRFRAPAGMMTTALRQTIAERKTEIIAALNQRGSSESTAPWPAAMADFVLLLTPDDLPSVPFALRPGVTVVDASRFLESLKRDIATGPEGPRALCGGIQSDLGCLMGLLNQDALRTGSRKEATS